MTAVASKCIPGDAKCVSKILGDKNTDEKEDNYLCFSIFFLFLFMHVSLWKIIIYSREPDE